MLIQISPNFNKSLSFSTSKNPPRNSIRLSRNAKRFLIESISSIKKCKKPMKPRGKVKKKKSQKQYKAEPIQW